MHAFRSGRLLTGALTAAHAHTRCILVFGGTDVNESYKTPSKLEIMTRAVQQAHTLVAFSPSIYTAAADLWPFCTCKMLTIPQSVPPPRQYLS